MKVLLIQPPTPKKSVGMDSLFLDEPLALEYLAADVASVCEVAILDMRLDRDLPKVMGGFQPDIIGVTGYITHVPNIRAICQQVKELQPRAITIVGGQHATIAPEDFMHPAIDIIVVGDGVPTLKELIQKLEKKEDPREVRGIAFSEKGGLYKTELRPLTSLDDFPFPDRTSTKRYRKHYHGEWMEPVALVRTSRGCPNQCSFCAQWKLTGRRYLKRSVDSIVKELQQIEAESVFFADDESFLDTKRMSELAKAIKSAGIQKKYRAVIRSDTVVSSPQMLEEWESIGLESLAVGLEFYSQEDLDYVRKGTSSRRNEEAITLLKGLGIHLSPLFIIRPDYDEHSFKAFGDYVRQFSFDRRVQFSVLTPLPGSELYEELKKQILDVDFEYFDCVHTVLPTKLPLREFYSHLARLYRTSNSPTHYLNYLRKLPFTRIMGTAWSNYRLLSRIENLYKDYAAISWE